MNFAVRERRGCVPRSVQPQPTACGAVPGAQETECLASGCPSVVAVTGQRGGQAGREHDEYQWRRVTPGDTLIDLIEPGTTRRGVLHDRSETRAPAIGTNAAQLANRSRRSRLARYQSVRARVFAGTERIVARTMTGVGGPSTPNPRRDTVSAMVCYVDTVRSYPDAGLRFTEFCHLLGDTRDELHAMAELVGMSRRAFQDHPWRWHYDLPGPLRARAIECGAREVTMHEVGALLKRRKSESPIA